MRVMGQFDTPTVKVEHVLVTDLDAAAVAEVDWIGGRLAVLQHDLCPSRSRLASRLATRAVKRQCFSAGSMHKQGDTSEKEAGGIPRSIARAQDLEVAAPSGPF